MRRLLPPCGLVVVLLIALTPSWLDAQAVTAALHTPADTPLAEAQALLESGRTLDAERLLERVVARRPLTASELGGRSSALAVLYLRVRARMLPVMAETLYGAAKTSYDEGRLDVASAQFDDLRRLVDSAEARIEGLSDLGMLAEGFSRLIRRQREKKPSDIPVEEIRVGVESPEPPQALPPTPFLEAVVPEPARSVPEAPQATLPQSGQATLVAEPKPFAPWRPQEYGSEDLDVRPPTTIAQTLPAWVAPNGLPASRTFRGLLAVVVGEDGLVHSADIVAPSFAGYDALLVSAAKRWRYEPAVKDGRPVRFRKLIEVHLRNRSGSD